MNNRLKKQLFLFLLLSLLSFSAPALTSDNIRSFTFENGLTLFTIDDSTTATVRIELDVDAGFNRQSRTTAGFFPLYARLIGGDCSADTVRIIKNIAPEDTEKTLIQLADCLSPLRIDDHTLSSILDSFKTEITGYAFSTAGFINTAIDARMFPASPWKHESGVYPSLFTKATTAEVRTILMEIGKRFYTPKNAVLIISGNLTPEKEAALVTKTFGLQPNNRIPTIPLNDETISISDAEKKQRKFVLVDPGLSAEMTQIVVQYTGFDSNQADLTAATFNEDDSLMKQQLLNQKQLGIRGTDYINTASVQQRGSSRLVIQSILEPSNITPVQQAQLFVKTVTATPAQIISETAVNAAEANINSEFMEKTDDAASLAELFSAWRALTSSTDQNAFFTRAQPAADTAEQLASILTGETPYVFVLINKTVFDKYTDSFKKAGFETVTAQNGSWYSMELYKQLTRISAAPSPKAADSDEENPSDRFISTNKAAFSSFALSNGIPVVVKRTENAQTAAIAIRISGGELEFAKTTPGLSTILTQALMQNITNEISTREKIGQIGPRTVIDAETGAISSVITITCAAHDVESCLAAASSALVYGDISPAQADAIVYDERTQQRIRNGTTTYQLLCAAIKTIYRGTDYAALYNDTADDSASPAFAEIRAAYPQLLESDRYSLILAGGLPEDSKLKQTIEQSFGILADHDTLSKEPEALPEPTFTKTTKKIQLSHRFLSDVAGDKAGPRPEILVPTKKFSDPVLYCLPAPKINTPSYAYFSALLYTFANRLQQSLGSNTTISVSPPDNEKPFAQILFSKVDKRETIETLYASAVKKLSEELQNTDSVNEIESTWVLNVLSDTGSPINTVTLISAGCQLNNPELYLDEYKQIHTATAADYQKIFEQWFTTTPMLRFYSADTH